MFSTFFMLQIPYSFPPGIFSVFKATGSSLASLGLPFSCVYTSVSVRSEGWFAVIPWLPPFVGHWSSCRAASVHTDSFQRRPSRKLSPKASQGLVGHPALIPGVSHTTMKSFGVYVTLLCKRKAALCSRGSLE